MMMINKDKIEGKEEVSKRETWEGKNVCVVTYNLRWFNTA